MKSFGKFLGVAALSLMCICVSVAYAAISGTLTVSGTAESSPAEGLFIVSVVPQNATNVYSHDAGYLPGSTTVKANVRHADVDEEGRIEYVITVANNTDITYCYRDIYYHAPLEGYNGNDLVSKVDYDWSIGVRAIFADDTLESKKVAPGQTITFTAVYTYGKDVDPSVDLATLVNFQFGVYVEGETEAIEAVEDKFLKILNTPSTYEHLLDILDNKFDGDPSHDWTTNYIGNVSGSTGEDSVAVENLFGGQLKIMIGDEPRDATVIIKHQNIDWFERTGDDYVATHPDGGVYVGTACEMTLYLTIESLDVPDEYKTVYAIVYTCERDSATGERKSAWYRVGNRYEGTARVVNYEGNWGYGSFQTDSWRTVDGTYQLVDEYYFNIDGKEFYQSGYSYTVPAGWAVTGILHIEDEALVNTFLSLMGDAKRILDDQTYAGEGIERIRLAYERYSYLCVADGTGTHWFNYNDYYWLKNAMINIAPAVAELDSAISGALTEISEMP